MPPSLSTRMAGLPRWAWLLILTSGLIMGLFLRKRSLENDTAGVDPTDQGDATGDPAPVEYGDAGVTAASAIPPGGAGGLTPVESPILPPGYADSFGDAIGGLVAIATNRDNVNGEVKQAAIENPPPTSPTSVATGGGPPSMVPARTAVKPPPPKPSLPKVERWKCVNGVREYYWHGNWHTARPDGTGKGVKCKKGESGGSG